MTLAQLRAVLALHEHGHFGLAAAAVCISQPALSQRISELEDEIGCKLFIRRIGKRSTVTPNGQVVVLRAREIMRTVGEMRAELV